jgi:hypothetical protein
VDVDDRLREWTDRFAHQRTDGEVGHVMVVHHVEMHQVGAGRHDVAHFLAQPREIRR